MKEKRIEMHANNKVKQHHCTETKRITHAG